MSTWSYTLNKAITDHTNLSEKLHTRLLTTPLNPKQALKLTWQTHLERTYAALTLAGKATSIKQVRSFLTKPSPAPLSKLTANYKLAIEQVHLDWTNNPAPFTTSSITDLHKLLAKSLKTRSSLRTQPLKIDLHSSPGHYTPPEPGGLPLLLDQITAEINQQDRAHSAIVAAITYAQIYRLQPMPDYNSLLASACTYAVMAKHNTGGLGLLNLEAQFTQETDQFFKTIESTFTDSSNFTPWIVYYTGALTKAQESTLSRLETFSTMEPDLNLGYAKLNHRQRAILSLLSKPNSTITNQQVVARFKTSPITASRDLAKLKNLGLLTQIGQGRSTTYTRLK